jgi:hypothetical protein
MTNPESEYPDDFDVSPRPRSLRERSIRDRRRRALRYATCFFVAIALGAGGVLGGCAAGVGSLVALVFGGGGGSGGEIILPTVTSVEPRQSTAVGGVAIKIRGRNFDPRSSVSFGAIAAKSVRFVSTEELIAVVPSSAEGLALDLDLLREDPAEFRLLYTETNPSLAIKVARGGGGESLAPFYYMRPRLRRVFREERDPSGKVVEVQGFGNRFERSSVVLEGDFFGFSNQGAATEIDVVRVEGRRETRIFTLRPIDPSSPENGPPGFFIEDGACDAPPCADDPHQGRRLRIRLPIEGDAGLFPANQPIVAGPIYRLRAFNRSGVDDIQFGYAPPFPPLDLVCAVEDGPGGKQVRLRWEDSNPLNEGGQPFTLVFVERYDPGVDEFVNLAIVPSGTEEFVDTSVESTNYLYRVYGQFRAENSPAVVCEVAVFADGSTDFVLELGAEGTDAEGGSSGKLSRVAGQPEQVSIRSGALGDSDLDRSGRKLQDLIERRGRPAFLWREQRPRGLSASSSANPSVSEILSIFDPAAARIAITWITSAGRAELGVDDVAILRRILDYYRAPTAPGGLYVEGQHLVAALEQILREDPDLRELLIDGRLGGLDVLDSVETFDVISNLQVAFGAALIENGSIVSSLDWSAANGGVAAYDRELLQSELDARQGKLLLAGTARRGGTIGRNVGSAFFVDAPGGAAGHLSRTIISYLPVEGFATDAARSALVQRFADVLSGTVPGIDPPREEQLPIVASIDPASRDWNSEGQVTFRGENLDLVVLVAFGVQPAEILERSATRIVVRLPRASVPGTVPVLLAIETEEGEGEETRVVERRLVVGEFRFSAAAPVITELPLPRSSSARGGDIVVLRGQGFTSPPDLRVLFDGVPATIDPSSRVDRVVVRAPRATSFPEGGDVPIELFTDGGTRTATVSFTYEPAPDDGGGGPDPGETGDLDVLTPTSLDVGGSTLIVRGPLLDEATVSVCDEPLVDTDVSALENGVFELRGIVPAGCGTCDVVAILPGGTRLVAPDALAYQSAQLISVEPAQAAVGDPVVFRIRNAARAVRVFLGADELVIRDRVDDGDAIIEAIVSRGTIGAKVDARVVNTGSPCAASTLSGAFEFLDPDIPRIVSISAASGPDIGGTPIGILGRGFRRAEATICDTPLENVVVVEQDLTIISGTTPAGCGVCDVVVRSDSGQDALPAAFTYLSPEVIDVRPRASVPRGGGAAEIRVRNLSSATRVFFGTTAATELSRGEDSITVQIPEGAMGSEVQVGVANEGSTCPMSSFVEPFRYTLPVLFFGDFSFDITSDHPITGASDLRALLESEDAVIDVDRSSGQELLTLERLRSYALVFFSDLSSRALSVEEAQDFRDYAEEGGVVVLLGQHGLRRVLASPGSDRADRNTILSRFPEFSSAFNGDLFIDPVNHIPYDGCGPNLCSPPEPSPEGDPDNGQEYALAKPLALPNLGVFLDELLIDFLAGNANAGLDPLGGVLFNWGQTIRVPPVPVVMQFPRALPLFTGSPTSFGDRNAVFVSAPAGCNDGHFTGVRDPDEPVALSGQVGIGVVAFGLLRDGFGLIFLVGDQEFLSNRYIEDGRCGAGLRFTHSTFVRNLIRTVRRIVAP